MNKIILLAIMFALSSQQIFAQNDEKESPRDFGSTKLLITGHATVTAVLDSGQSNFTDANFSAIFLYHLSENLFVESEIEIETGGGSPDIGLEHANLVWMVGKNIAFHAGRFVPHFGMYRGRLAEGFMNRFPTDPVGFGDGGIGTMQAVGFGFQGGLPLGTAKMNYDLWVSDGPQLLTDQENAGQFEYEAYTDNNKNKAVGGRFGFLPFSNSCLELGLSYEDAMKTENQYTLPENVGVKAMAIDANFYHKVDALKSTVRLIGEYKKQTVDKVTYSIQNESGASVDSSFDNSANTFYAVASIRPTASDNDVLRNFEIAFRYSKYNTPNGAPWAYYENGVNKALTQTAVAINYWLKWNCVAKACYQIQKNMPNQVYIQLYYGF